MNDLPKLNRRCKVVFNKSYYYNFSPICKLVRYKKGSDYLVWENCSGFRDTYDLDMIESWEYAGNKK